MEHEVARGECLSRIARQYGRSVLQIWNDPANKELREKRKTPNLLFPGDKVVIPPKGVHRFEAKTGQRHTLSLQKGSSDSNLVRLRFKDAFGEPVSGLEFKVTLPDGNEISGTTDSDGKAELELAADVERVNLSICDVDSELVIGDLNPVARVEGVQQRLNNLGFGCGAVDGDVGPKTRRSLIEFQNHTGLTPSGVADEATRCMLERIHDGVSRGSRAEDSTESVKQLRIVDEDPCDESTTLDMDPSEAEILEYD
jgi:hypothetical protein